MTMTLELPDDDVVYIAEQLLGEAVEAGYKEMPQRFVISEDTVLDTTTGLTWQRLVSEREFTWKEAQDYAANLELDGGGWRVPDVKELGTLVDSEAFSNTPSDWFWSASPYANSSNYAWSVNFYNGYTNYYDVYNSNRVRCVR